MIKEKVKFLFLHWPVVLATLIFAAALAVIFFASVKQNNGNFVYTLDDPYIHMGISKHIAKEMVWGINDGKFVSASSSPLWVVILALFFTNLGFLEIIPFILNIIFGVGVIFVSYFILKKQGLSNLLNFLFLTLLIFAVPLPLLAFVGMEHALHLLLSIIFLFLAWQYLDSGNKNMPVLLPASAALLTATRYEGAFLVAIVCVLLFFKKKFIKSTIIAICGATPILLFGFYSVLNGGLFIPNSILIKTDTYTQLMQRMQNSWHALLFSFIIFNIVLSVFLIFHIFFFQKNDRRSNFLLLAFILVAFVHTLFASIGWFLRYEAYLVGLGIFVVAFSSESIIRSRKHKKFVTVIIVCLILVLAKTYHSRIDFLKFIPQASANIYEQQYQMALFFKTYYAGQSIALNDIGAVSFLSGVNVVDLVGLANNEVANSKLSGFFSTEYIDEICKKENVKVAAIYDSWFQWQNSPPKNWQKVGVWKIENLVSSASDTVSFYAVNADEKENLKKNLENFGPRLPKTAKYFLFESGKLQ
jgi:hypothetical protein